MASAPARSLGALALAGVSALAWASLVEVRWYALREVTVPVLPPGQAPLRILQLA
ncbi:MAG: metallophosphoesterase, partial [Cellulomonadaceae bacterium]|nr:metallophosphoesterase [Cellulomonadaceae bacterium]